MPWGVANDGPMSVTQERRLLTELPGPRSRELQDRKNAAVSAGVGVGLPAISRAGAASSSTSTATT